MAARDRLDGLISGFRATQVIRAAAVHNVADVLASQPLDAVQVASRTGCDPEAMGRLLRCLAALGVVTQSAEGTFANSELGHLLRSDVVGSLRSAAIGRPQDTWWSAWAQLPAALRGDEVAYKRARGHSFWDEIAGDPVTGSQFNEFMADKTTEFLPELLREYDFSRARRIVDVGGGTGALLGGILQQFPDARGVLFDLPSGLARAPQILDELGVGHRCDVVPGSFFDAVPEDGDTYILRQILHDWPDDQARQILSVCRRAMTPNARLLLIDRVLPECATDNPDDRTSFEFDLQMFVLFGARERTERVLLELIDSALLHVDTLLSTRPESTFLVRTR